MTTPLKILRMRRKKENSTKGAAFNLTPEEFAKAKRAAGDYSPGQLARYLLLKHLGIDESSKVRIYRSSKTRKTVCACPKTTPDLGTIVQKACSK